MSDPKYFVTEVSECPECEGRGFIYLSGSDREMKLGSRCPNATLFGDNQIERAIKGSGNCYNGEIIRRVDLLEVLGRLRWDNKDYSLFSVLEPEIRFENLRIESDENK